MCSAAMCLPSRAVFDRRGFDEVACVFRAERGAESVQISRGRSEDWRGACEMLRDGTSRDQTWTSTSDHHGDRCERVHRTLKRIVKARGALDAQEAAALREAADLMLWRRYGCASLVDYLEREMGYT